MLKRILVVVIAAAFATSVLAQSGADEARIAELEKAVKELQDCQGQGKSMYGCNLLIYGYVRMDMSYTDSQMTDAGGGAIHFYSEQEDKFHDNDNEFKMTARSSRVGLILKGDESAALKSSAKVEFDFSNGGSETSNTPRIRHAYLELEMPDSNFSILAGQTWDVIAPVLPPTIDNSVLWFQGDTGMRRTQFRLTQKIPLGGDTTAKLEGALARQIGSATNMNGYDSGDDSGIPSLQGRASITTPLFSGLKSTFGVSGLYGQEEYDIDSDNDENVDLDSWLVAFDMSVPLSNSTKVVGEIYTGANTGRVGGAINQTVSTSFADVDGDLENELTGAEEIESTGGWFALSQKLSDKVTVSGGYAHDNVDADTIVAGNRQSNQTAFANVIYYPLKNVKTGFEFAHNKTEYQDGNDGDALRGTFFMQYNF